MRRLLHQIPLAALVVVWLIAMGLAISPPMAAAAGGWDLQNPPTFNGVDFADSSTGWAVAGGGAITSTTDGGATWTSQSSGTSAWLNGVDFANSATGWVVGNGGTILKTTDGGANWAPQLSGTAYDLVSVTFVDDSNGWVSGAGVILHTNDGGATWTPQTPATPAYLTSISFVDASHGWAVGGNSIQHTVDGGVNWVAQDPGTTEYLMAAEFVDESTGWVVGGNGLILSTLDGGETWTPQVTASFDYLNAVTFTDSLTGWSVGGSGTIQRTTDGGATWELQSWGTPWVNMYSASFTDELTGWAVGEGGTILSTLDGGVTWTPQVAALTAHLRGVDFVDASTGWAVGDAGTIVKTSDGGATLEPQVSGTAEALTAVSFADSAIGWVVGGGGTILGTTDGGATWEAQDSGTTESLSGVAFVGATAGWAVGSNGAIVHTADGGATWTAQDSGQGPYPVGLSGVTFTSATDGWAVGEAGVLARTTNGGATWVVQDSGVFENLYDVTFTSASDGWIVGGNGTLLRTTNGGASWTPQASDTGEYLYSIAFGDALNGWAVGSNGAAVETTDGGATWVNQGLPTIQYLYCVDFPTATKGWAVGEYGAVIAYAPSGYNILPSAGPGGVIDPYVPQVVAEGGSVAFTITPDPGYAINVVVVDEVPVGAVTSYEFTDVTGDHSIHADFVKTWEITATPPTNGSITPAGTTTVHEGSNATYTVTADASYRVGEVTDNGVPVSLTDGKYVVANVSADHTIAATFIKTWEITASAGAHGAIAPSGVTAVDEGANATFTVTPDTGYHVLEVTDNGAPVTLVDSEYVVTDVAENHTIAATFAINTYTLTYTPGANGTLTGVSLQTVDYNGSGTEVTAVPDPGYRFVDWSDGVLNASRTDSNVTGDLNVTANFAIGTYTIAASAGANGAISPAGAVVVTALEDQTFTFTPAAGYHVSALTVDDIPVLAPGSSYTFTGVLANHTINVEFALNPVLQGTITNGVTPLYRTTVTAFDANTHASVKGVFTDAAGFYTMSLPPGSYHLRFTGMTPSSLTQFYDHQATINSAAVIALDGSEVRTVSSDLAPPTPPTVQSLQGVITNGVVPLNRVTVTAFDATTHMSVKGVFTDATGAYFMALPAGSYHLRFTGTTPASLTQFYDHQATINTANVVVLAAGEAKTVSSDLAPPPVTTQSILGVITNGATPLNRVTVSAFDATTHAYVKGVFTDAAGAYQLSLPAGSYHIRFTGMTPSSLTQFYNHQARIVAADIVVLNPGVNTPVSSDLAGPIAP